MYSVHYSANDPLPSLVIYYCATRWLVKILYTEVTASRVWQTLEVEFYNCYLASNYVGTGSHAMHVVMSTLWSAIHINSVTLYTTCNV